MSGDSDRPAFDAGVAETLALRIAAGDTDAFEPLVAMLWPEWLAIVRASRTMGRRGRSDDDVRDVASRLLARLKQDDFRALRLYRDWRERHPDKTFHDWLRIVAANATRDFVRERRAAIRGEGLSEDLSASGLLNEFTRWQPFERLGVRPPVTAAQTARELLDFAERRLPSAQREALRAWLEGATFEEMDAGEGRAPGSAKKLVRAAIATLRREFGDVR
jgi:DNA-directed RNA polymerase specialized sigma24 family protein